MAYIDHHLEKEQRMWWEAYLASLSGLRAAEGEQADRDLFWTATQDADAALTAYRNRWGLEEVPNG